MIIRLLNRIYGFFTEIRCRKWLICFIFWVFLGLNCSAQTKKTRTTFDIKYALKSLYPDGFYVGIYRHEVYFVFNGNHVFVGSAIKSSAIENHKKGYAGSVPLLIGIDSANIISGIRLLPNLETEKYIDLLDSRDYLNRWTGMKVYPASFQMVNAVSGATETCHAIYFEVQKVLKAFVEGNIEQYPTDKKLKKIML